jgi:endonuclease YncB( thermonuclease family)
MQPRVQPILLVIAAVGALAAAVLAGRAGQATVATLLFVIALGALALSALPVLLGVQAPPPALAAILRATADIDERIPAGLRKAVAAAAALVVLLPLSWILVSHIPRLASVPGLGVLGSHAVEGRAFALSGDTLRVRDTVVRLAGVEAPLISQRCSKPGNRRWRCGEAAQDALARTLRAGTVRCDLSGTDEAGQALGTCYMRDKDIASGLVREGALFSSGGFLASYGSEEKQAKAERAGLWQGEAERPSDYRAKLWEAAKRSSPDECPIKGQVSSGGKYYLVPWSPNYPRAQVRAHRGERWFCSEREAVAAGWKPLDRG